MSFRFSARMTLGFSVVFLVWTVVSIAFGLSQHPFIKVLEFFNIVTLTRLELDCIRSMQVQP